MTQLSVNLNKVALLRNSRGRNFPDLLKVARDVLQLGAHGITLHPRPDERHAKRSDVAPMIELVQSLKKLEGRPLEMNVEGYPSADWLDLVLKLGPDQATLVPDAPDALTSNSGWDFEKHEPFLLKICETFRNQNIRSSLFLEVDRMNEAQWRSLDAIRPDRVELYTEAYAEAHSKGDVTSVLNRYKSCAKRCLELGLELNAGHDLDLLNLETLLVAVPEIKEVSIGHALICEALYSGLETTINGYLEILATAKTKAQADVC